MIDAYVDGRPMPRSSSALTSDRLGVARRRGRRVAVRLELARLDGVADLGACGSRRSSSSSARLVAARLVGGEEAAEGDHRAGRAELGVVAVRRSSAPSRIDTVWPRASAICEAIVRFQISS